MPGGQRAGSAPSGGQGPSAGGNTPVENVPPDRSPGENVSAPPPTQGEVPETPVEAVATPSVEAGSAFFDPGRVQNNVTSLKTATNAAFRNLNNAVEVKFASVDFQLEEIRQNLDRSMQQSARTQSEVSQILAMLTQREGTPPPRRSGPIPVTEYQGSGHPTQRNPGPRPAGQFSAAYHNGGNGLTPGVAPQVPVDGTPRREQTEEVYNPSGPQGPAESQRPGPPVGQANLGGQQTPQSGMPRPRGQQADDDRRVHFDSNIPDQDRTWRTGSARRGGLFDSNENRQQPLPPQGDQVPYPNPEEAARTNSSPAPDGSEKARSEVRRYLLNNSKRPETFGEKGVNTLSIREFQRQVKKFLQAYGETIPLDLETSFVLNLIEGAPRQLLDAIPLCDLTPTIIWSTLYKAQPLGASELPAMLRQAAQRIEMKASSTDAQAQESFDAYTQAYSKLNSLAMPLDNSETYDQGPVRLPRADELIEPFLAGLKKACALGTLVGTTLSQDQGTRRTLTMVMERARATAMENPELLLAPTFQVHNTPKRSVLAALHAPPEDTSWDSPYDTHAEEYYYGPTYFGAFGSRGNQRNPRQRSPKPRRPNQPAWDGSKQCIICMLLFPDQVTPGRGHEAPWCIHVIGEYAPGNPNCQQGPADEKQLLKALDEAVRIARYGRESTAKSQPVMSRPDPRPPPAPLRQDPVRPTVLHLIDAGAMDTTPPSHEPEEESMVEQGMPLN
jgi:hypothetical protein